MISNNANQSNLLDVDYNRDESSHQDIKVVMNNPRIFLVPDAIYAIKVTPFLSFCTLYSVRVFTSSLRKHLFSGFLHDCC